MRCGIGYDVHPFCPGRKLILGGVEISHPQGLRGHSDADVVVHSIADALLGACGERDIGYHFPDTDPQYRGACSLDMLGKVCQILKRKKFTIINVDATLILQEPAISSFIPRMKNNIAVVLNIDQDQVGMKATSPEGVGSLGEKKGAACLSVACIEEK